MTESSTWQDQGSNSIPKRDAAYWQDEIESWEKRVRKWHKRGGNTVKKYEEDKAGDATRSLNIFHSNVNTLLSMLYGAVPKVDVSRRHADQNDDISRVASLMLHRILNTDIQISGESFASMLRSALQDRLLPGLGTARARYSVKTEKVQVAAQIDMLTGETLVEGYEEERVVSEHVDFDYVHWEDFAWSYARTWDEVNWIGFRTRLQKHEVEARFGKKIAKKLQYKRVKPTDDSGNDTQDSRDTAEIWEIWDKETRTVYWFQKSCAQLLDKKADPLKLQKFYPCPSPMIANTTTKQYLPTPDYVYLQDLYNEIDVLQTRIHYITKALKVVGVYDKSNDGVKRIMTEGTENDLVPVDNWAMFAERGGMKGVVDWFPLETVANTLDRLRGIRNETIELLYSTSGLQDAMGSALTGGQPSSATEQALRARKSSVNVQFLQDDFARFASDLQRIKAEIIARHYEPETIVKQSHMNNSIDQQLIPQALQLIKNPGDAVWAIEIRPESIAMIDYAQLKSERTEYLTALSTYLQSAQAAGKVAPSIGPMLMELLKWGLAGFKGSSEIEGVVDQAMDQLKKDQQAAQQAQSQQPPDPALIKAQMDMQKQLAKFQQDMQKQWLKSNQEMQKLSAELRKDLATIHAKSQADVNKEAAQAHFNILEKRASGGRGEIG